jgi:hypothetical protein
MNIFFFNLLLGFKAGIIGTIFNIFMKAELVYLIYINKNLYD